MKRVALAAPAAKFVAGGGRDVRHDDPVAAGEQVQLVDEAGDEVGLAVGDPDNTLLRVLALPADGFARIDAALLGWRVERALAWRRQLGLPGPDHAYRIVHGAGDGLPGFACDVLGRVAVVYVYGAGLRALGRQLAEAIMGFARLDGAVVKLRSGTATEVAQDTLGKVDDRVTVTEHGVPFEVHPLGGLNTGLFTDMREQRRGLARFTQGKRVLNLFSYTASLGVAAMRGGATAVTNVDTSPGVQAWAQANFALSKVAGAFETGDAVRFLARAARDGERYDVVLIDPPSSSTARGQSWTTGRDYPALIAQAAAVIPPDGVLWLAANTVELGPLAKLARKAVPRAIVVEQAGLPPEYPTVAAQPSDRYLQVCVLRV